jgi:hypothetical protein
MNTFAYTSAIRSTTTPSNTSCRGVPARILANFYTKRRRHQRQIDLFVITPQRATLIELKNFNPSFPLTAGVNGPWQTLPDGRLRPLDGNGIHQAKECTFSLNDEMRRLAEGGEVPAEKRFYACIDTVVCLYPTIPAGSTIERADHVTVLGYDLLVERLTDCTRSCGAWP